MNRRFRPQLESYGVMGEKSALPVKGMISDRLRQRCRSFAVGSSLPATEVRNPGLGFCLGVFQEGRDFVVECLRLLDEDHVTRIPDNDQPCA